MKKLFTLIFVGIIAVSFAACGQKKNELKEPEKSKPEVSKSEVVESEAEVSNDIMTGGWSIADSPKITEDIKKLVEKATEKLTGVTYSPVVYVGSQVVAGTNHLVLCKAEPVVQNPTVTYSLLTIYEDPQGNAEITEILTSDAEAGVPGLAGGWNSPDSPELTKEAKTVLEAAAEKLVGAEYMPVALLGTQVVAGTNYSILCETKAVTQNAESAYAVVIVYENLQGVAEITDIYAFESDAD